MPGWRTSWDPARKGHVRTHKAHARSPRTTLGEFTKTACDWHLRVYRVKVAFDEAMLRHAGIKMPKHFYASQPDPRRRTAQWTWFTKTAKLIDELGVSDRDFIEAQFHWFDKALGKLPGANQLYSEAAVERWAEFKKNQRPKKYKPPKVADSSGYYDRIVRKAEAKGGDRVEVLKRGVMSGIIPDWYAKETLGRNWKSRYLSEEERELVEGREDL